MFIMSGVKSKLNLLGEYIVCRSERSMLSLALEEAVASVFVSVVSKLSSVASTSSLVLSAIILWNPMPTPSMTAKRHPQAIAELKAARRPPLMARAPPVKNPAITMIVNYCA